MQGVSSPCGVAKLDVFLYRWIISDGNYDDFKAGQKRDFALEFWAPVSLRKSTKRQKHHTAISGYRYRVGAEIVFASDEAWVIDCGFLSYSESANDLESGVSVGDFVEGEVTFDVDPFFYFERLHCLDDMPALIYTWRINSIDQDTSPMLLSEACGRPVHVRDEQHLVFAPVSGTHQNVVSPPEASLNAYVLHCDLLSVPARRQLQRQFSASSRLLVRLKKYGLLPRFAPRNPKGRFGRLDSK